MSLLLFRGLCLGTAWFGGRLAGGVFDKLALGHASDLIAVSAGYGTSSLLRRAFFSNDNSDLATILGLLVVAFTTGALARTLAGLAWRIISPPRHLPVVDEGARRI
ncbi:MAG: hypothetical protein WD226_03095 [Planctomycetota bacterium]